MSPAVPAQPPTTDRDPDPVPDSGAAAADVLVVFGITGDLAKVMTFRSLYRLEKRGLLELPDRRGRGRRLDARAPARARARMHRRNRRVARRRGLRALRRAPLLRERRFHQRGHLRAPGGRGRRRAQPGLLPGDPPVPVRRGDQAAEGRRPDEDRARGRREAVRPRPAVRARARGGNPRVTSTSRSSTGSTTSSARWAPTSCCTCASRTR